MTVRIPINHSRTHTHLQINFCFESECVREIQICSNENDLTNWLRVITSQSIWRWCGCWFLCLRCVAFCWETGSGNKKWKKMNSWHMWTHARTHTRKRTEVVWWISFGPNSTTLPRRTKTAPCQSSKHFKFDSMKSLESRLSIQISPSIIVTKKRVEIDETADERWS